MVPFTLDTAARVIVVVALVYASVVALTHWAVRRRKIGPFGPWPRLVRRLSDPVLLPLERRVIRFGGSPQDAPLWLLGIVIVGGLVLVSVTNWILAMTGTLGALAYATPRDWIRLVVGWAFSLVMLAIFVRVIASWFGVSELPGLDASIGAAQRLDHPADPPDAACQRHDRLQPHGRVAHPLGGERVRPRPAVRPSGPVRPNASGARLQLRVQPRASRDEIAGISGGAIRVRLMAPPVDGAANDALLRLLAARLDLPRSALTLVSGHTGRTKVVAVDGVSAEEVGRRLGL